MAVYNVKLPDGGTLKLEGPDGASDEQIIAQAQKLIKAERPNKNYARPVIGRPLNGYGPVDAMIRSGSLGLDTIANGLGNVAVNAIQAPLSSKVDFDPLKAFEEGRQGSVQAGEDFGRESPFLSGASTLAGFLTGAPAKALAAVGQAPGLLTRILQGIGVGGASGAVAGATSSLNPEDMGANGVNGAIAGSLVGGAIPAAGALGGRALSGVRNILGNGNGLALQRVGEALSSDAVSPAVVGAMMDEARTLGVPRMLADTGENTRRLLGSVARQPGPARSAVVQALRDRQLAQGERLQSAITRDLGPVGNVADQSEALIDQANKAAAPLYERANANYVPDTPQLQSLLGTPAGRSALSRAKTIAANERNNPAELGFALDADGNVLLNPRNFAGNRAEVQAPAYTQQTLDYVKRGLDSVLEDSRDPITRRLKLDDVGRSVEGVRKDFVRTVDSLNPDYAAARAAYSGPARERDALQLGRDMVNASDGDIQRAVTRMTESEKKQFALGMRSTLSENLNRRVDGGDKVGYLSNSPQRRSILQHVVGPEADLERFQRALGHEDAVGQTYRAAMTGSPTAVNLADDAIVGDGGVAGSVLSRLVTGSARNGLWSGISSAVQPLLDAPRFGVGRVGNRVREEIGALLTETDPLAFTRALDDFSAASVRKRIRAGRLSLQGSSIGGAVSGYGASYLGQ